MDIKKILCQANDCTYCRCDYKQCECTECTKAIQLAKPVCTYDEEIDAWLEKHPDWSGDCRYGATKEMSYFEYCSCDKPVFCGCGSCS